MNLDIRPGFEYHSDELISQNSSKPPIVKSFYLLRMSNDYCFRRAAQKQLSQCNRRITATVLRAVVKSHNGLKGTKVFACGCSGRNLKNLSKFAGKSRCWGPFIVKLQPVIAYKRLLGQLYQKKRRLHRDSFTSTSCKFWKKNMNMTINTSTRLPLK